MAKAKDTTASGQSQDKDAKEKANELAETNKEEVKAEESAEEKTEAEESEKSSKSESAEDDEKTSSNELGEETEEEKEETKEEAEDGTLEKFFEEEEPITYKKTPKYPDIEEGDVSRTIDGTPVIHAKHLLDDLEEIFGSEKKEPNLKTFLHINNAKHKKATVLAQLAGFRSRHHLAGAIEELNDAKTIEERDAVLNDLFPEWTHKEGVTLPFDVSLKEAEKKAEEQIEETGLAWKQSELDRAIDKYVAASDGSVKREDILKSAELRKNLEKFSGYSKGGQPLEANEALKMAIGMTNIVPTPISKDKKVSLGGGGKQRKTKTIKIGNAYQEHVEAAKKMGMSPITEEEFIRQKKADAV